MAETTFPQVQQAMDAWKKLMDEQMTRMSASFEEVGKLSEKSLNQTMTGIDEMAKLMKDTFTYANNLSTEWRKMTVDATRKATDAVKSKIAA